MTGDKCNHSVYIMSNQLGLSFKTIIDKFNRTDLALTLAVAADDWREIERTSKAWEEMLEKTLSFHSTETKEKLALADFLGDRFLLSEICSFDAKVRAMKKLRTLIADGSGQAAR